MKKDLDDLIGTAAEQHRRLATTLDSLEPEALGLEPDICRALKLPLQIELIVTLDAVSVWATEIHKLKSIAVVDTDCRVTMDRISNRPNGHYRYLARSALCGLLTEKTPTRGAGTD